MNRSRAAVRIEGVVPREPAVLFEPGLPDEVALDEVALGEVALREVVPDEVADR